MKPPKMFIFVFPEAKLKKKPSVENKRKEEKFCGSEKNKGYIN